MDVFLLVGGVIGVLAGWRWKILHRAASDLTGAKAAVRRIRWVYWRNVGWSLLWAIGILILLWTRR